MQGVEQDGHGAAALLRGKPRAVEARHPHETVLGQREPLVDVRPLAEVRVRKHGAMARVELQSRGRIVDRPALDLRLHRARCGEVAILVRKHRTKCIAVPCDEVEADLAVALECIDGVSREAERRANQRTCSLVP